MFHSGAMTGAAAEQVEDRNITLAVETELFQEEGVPSHKIDAETQDGIVILTGSVDQYLAKVEAERVAQSVKGVRGVINRIRVTPPVRLESQIRGDVLTALAVDPVTEPYEIDVSVNQAVVTLSGEVDSPTEKEAAEEVAQRVKGVAGVRNALTFDFTDDRTDADIKADIKRRFRTDASIASGGIDVEVNDGKVTLAGSVLSAVEKDEALAEAWRVPGVESVANQLEVQWWLDEDASDWDGAWDDESMRRAVERELGTNPRVKAFNVITMVEEGVATLTGQVDNLLAKWAAESEASDTLGIRRVKNLLRVRPAVTRTDQDVAENVRQALQRDPYVDRYDIDVRVFNGLTYLSGEVESSYMRRQAERAAAGVRGVVAIQNNLRVDRQHTAKADREIEQDVESQLWWNPRVDSDAITVEVNAGVVTLIGKVNDWPSREAAEEEAWDGGATEVINKLEVNNGSGTG
jgi:osmotically-inducible protein OsmY